ncbi:MAG: DUF4038 domain-containing protein, partial [Actinomycetota bacterium]
MSRPTTETQGPRRRLLRRGILLALAVLLLAGVQWVRDRYYVMGILRTTTTEWLTIHTRLYVASSDETDEQIGRAPFRNSDRLSTGPARGPLTVLASNARYFTDGMGEAVFLTGSHTWSNFQDSGDGYPPPPFDYEQYLDFLEVHGHNFFRLWVWEGGRWAVQTSNDDYWFHPMGPFVRSGPGNALDGRPRWDLTRFDQAYFDRLRERVRMAGDRGMYAAVMLFQGWAVSSVKGRKAMQNPWRGHPLHVTGRSKCTRGGRFKVYHP